MAVTLTFPVASRRKNAPPPKHLEKPERILWGKIVALYSFDDAALALLASAMEAHGRMRRCREIVDRDGEVISDRFGQSKPNPATTIERDARSAFHQAMKMLSLDLGTGGEK